MNNGPSDATGVTLVDTLPALTDMTVVSASTSVSGVTPTIAGNVVTAVVGNVAAGQTFTVDHHRDPDGRGSPGFALARLGLDLGERSRSRHGE